MLLKSDWLTTHEMAVPSDWFIHARLTPETGQVIGEELVLRLRRIAMALTSGARRGVHEAEQLVSTLARWLGECPRYVLSAIHDQTERAGVRSHALAVSCLMMNLAMERGMSSQQVRELGLGGLLHDIGKLTVPEAILDKPGRLDREELAIMRRHADDGAQILEAFPELSPTTIAVTRHHHERIDGTGYPSGLSGDEVTEPMRMAAICDVYDALISTRVYKHAWDREAALAEMRRAGHFDPDLLEAFTRSLERLH